MLDLGLLGQGLGTGVEYPSSKFFFAGGLQQSSSLVLVLAVFLGFLLAAASLGVTTGSRFRSSSVGVVVSLDAALGGAFGGQVWST